MRVPLSWLRDHVALPASVTGREVGERLVRAGLEVERVEQVGEGIAGPIVVGRVLTFVEEEHSNGKTVRWCRVDVGPEHNEPADGDVPAGRGIVCGARNFAVGDLVPVSLPGAVLPGGFAISARKTYGHVSDGMICSARELGMGEEHDGIIVLPAGAGEPGDDAIALLQLVDEVLDIAVTPDRGYCLSIRGVAREAATAFGVGFDDPAALSLPAVTGDDWPVALEDVDGCDRFVMRSVTGFDVTATSPLWLQRRLQMGGMRPISLAVDVTNYVMLELGQPLHAYDRSSLKGAIVVRAAQEGERLTTLDDVERALTSDDLLITDDSGPVGLAGVMGGATTEIGPESTDIVIEAAHFSPTRIARAARRHRLPSEASRRFERGVDTQLQEAAAERAVSLLAELGGATVEPTRTVVDHGAEPAVVQLDLTLPSRLVGHPYDADEVVTRLRSIGAEVTPADDGAAVEVSVPSWRPDLRMPEDLVEEVARLHGYDAIPSQLPRAGSGAGWTAAQRLRRRVGLVLAGAGYVEVQAYPFVATTVGDHLMWGEDDVRRRALRLANPLSDEEPCLRTSLLPGLLQTLRRNVGRGLDDVALFETGLVFRPGEPAPVPQVGVSRRPTQAEVAALDALIPAQPRHVATAACGDRTPSGWWGEGRAVSWADAVESARTVAAAAGVELTVEQAEQAPWHPGRCAALVLDGVVIGHAGELHPRVVAALGLPARTVAMELDLDAVTAAEVDAVAGPRVDTYPVAKEDVALVVTDDVPAERVRQALVAGIDPGLLESVRLFDVYTGEQVGEGRRSLAFALRLRAGDRTLTVDEVSAARDAAVAEAGRRTGAVLRS